MSDNITMKNTDEKQTMTKTDLLNALGKDFATNVKRIFINSLGKEIGFAEITVKQQKTLSRIMIDNESRKDIVFEAQCALINEACLEKDKFDIYKCTEFDRLKLLIALYQANMFKNEVTFKCSECGTENKFKLDFGNALIRLDQIDLAEKKFEYENSQWKFNFICRYPSVTDVLAFHRSYVKKYRGAAKQQIQSIDNMSNMDYINLFIKTIDFTSKVTNETKTIDFAQFDVGDIEEIIAVFPQDVLYSDDGVLKFIVNEYIKKMNDVFDKHECFQCGKTYEGDVNSPTSFL